MNLSKDERRRLAELAEQLAREDPTLSDALTGRPGRRDRLRRALRGHGRKDAG